MDPVMEYFKWYALNNLGLINPEYCPKNPYTNDFLEWARSLKKEVLVSEVYRKFYLAMESVKDKKS